ncbi:glycosyltransferase family 2 protein [Novosphingobium sp. M1R2S20]|uniref:Glycosyltransferase family 2 protein n=1 Tax=Novosphingobium rhizovicinum TaxID=3228928 RepID=A0ABV3RCT4_9SPHN
MLTLTRAALDPSMYFLAVMGLLASWMVARSVAGPNRYSRLRGHEGQVLLGSVALGLLGSGVITLLMGGSVGGLAAVVVSFLVIAIALARVAPKLNMPGVILLTTEVLTFWFGFVWTALFLREAGLPANTLMLAGAGMVFGGGVFALAFAERFARDAVLTHGAWRTPVDAPRGGPGTRSQRVSIQLPCYAEPPEVVIATMDRLAALEHDNFEVLVCDNNTKDEALWRPLEAHCARLNTAAGKEVFRFFHVSPLPGAKAGALNFCLEVMDPAAEFVAVIDADYLAQPDFLARLLPFFRDQRVGYVQTPHDYRDYEESPYLTSCYWEYMPNNKVDMIGVSEYGGAFTIGTMCILRTAAIREAGGWAEWCLTEDSEISVRLRAVGYSGYYIGETFGRGLIPETFSDYKKQRFRWTAGPVQQLRRHWRLFLPSPWAKPLPGWTKMLEVLRCIAPLRVLFAMIGGLLGFGALAAALISGVVAPVKVPDAAWVMFVLGTGAWLVGIWHRYKLTGTTRIPDMVRGEIARNALTYTVLQAGLAGLSSKPLAWRRTPKFAVDSAAGSIFADALPETLIGIALLAFAGVTVAAADTIGANFALLSALTIASLAIRFLCAPYLAWLALRHARAQARKVGGSDATPPSPSMLASGA